MRIIFGWSLDRISSECCEPDPSIVVCGFLRLGTRLCAALKFQRDVHRLKSIRRPGEEQAELVLAKARHAWQGSCAGTLGYQGIRVG